MTAKGAIQSIALLALLGLVGCAANSPTDSGAVPSSGVAKPRVVATHSVLCDLTQQIAADTVNLTCLMAPGTDPHVYQATPQDGKAIETANLILYGGYNFEPQLIRLINATSNPAPKIAVSEVAVPKPLMGAPHDHDHAESAAHAHEGEDQTAELAPDPHVWHNAQNGVQMVEVIREHLAQVAPAQAALYAENAEKLTAELNQIDRWIKSEIATIPASARKLITTHDAMGYYAAAYGIPIEGALSGLSTEEKPTPTRVRELVTDIKAAAVPTVFAEVSINPTLIETVAKEADVKVSEQELFADGLGEPGSAGDTYQTMLIANTQAIVEGLGGQFTPFAAKTSRQLSVGDWLAGTGNQNTRSQDARQLHLAVSSNFTF